MVTYTVQSGDTLFKIARKFYNDGSKYSLIQEANNMGGSSLLRVGQTLMIPGLEVEEEEEEVSSLLDYHSAFAGGTRWRLTPFGVYLESIGMELKDMYVRKIAEIWDNYADSINFWADQLKVPCELILATIATESGGRSFAVREEPGFISDEQTPQLVSAGLMQLLISTARWVLDDNFINRDWLKQPSNSIHAGTAYIIKQRPKTYLDPPKVACAYNEGSIIFDQSNHWRMQQTEGHCDRFVGYFNAAVFTLKTHPMRPRIEYDQFYFGDQFLA